MAEPIVLEYHRPTKGVGKYEQLLVLDRPDVKVLLQRRHIGESLRVEEELVLEAGAPMLWFVFPGAWHDIARFHRVDRTFTGWYTNLCKPVEIGERVWRITDLFLDCWQPARGGSVWLDEDEFDQAVRDRVLDSSTKKRVLNERALIDLQLAGDAWPPPIARDIDIAQATLLMEEFE